MLTSSRKFLTKFLRARGGNIAILFALTLTPVLMTVGCAIDYARATQLRTKLQSAIDAASISSVSRASPGYAQAGRMASDGPLDEGIADARSIFRGNITNLIGYTEQPISAVVTKTAQNITSDLSFTATVPTSFLTIMGYKNLTVTGTSKSVATLPSYIDFYLLLDNSPSMGVGATTADVNKMVAKMGCAFACHDMSNPTNNNYQIAKNNGFSTRIDVLRSATEQLMDTATNTRAFSTQFRMALYDFGGSAATAKLRSLYALSSNLAAAKTAAGNIDLMTVAYQNEDNDQLTKFSTILPAIGTQITTPGPGTSDAPQKFLFFVSDGVADEYNPGPCQKSMSGSRCQSPLNPALCQKLKDKGIKIAVLYTTYLELPDNGWYNDWIKPFNAGPYGPSPNSEIAKNMESCASPGLYFEVSMSQGISEAMNALFQKAVGDARISS